MIHSPTLCHFSVGPLLPSSGSFFSGLRGEGLGGEGGGSIQVFGGPEGSLARSRTEEDQHCEGLALQPADTWRVCEGLGFRV